MAGFSRHKDLIQSINLGKVTGIYSYDVEYSVLSAYGQVVDSSVDKRVGVNHS